VRLDHLHGHPPSVPIPNCAHPPLFIIPAHIGRRKESVDATRTIAHLIAIDRKRRESMSNPTMRPIFIAAAALLWPAICAADGCPGHPGALGTSRVLAVDARTTPRVGLKQFPRTLPLEPHEVVLTFDDGPWPGTTPKVLDALARECAKATFFVIGSNAAASPALLRRELEEGHTIGTHSWSHPLLSRLTPSEARNEIEHGMKAVNGILGGKASLDKTPFFRFPGFAATDGLMDWLNGHGVVVFGADLWASDWNRMTPETELALVLRRLDLAGGGILLLHDTKQQTAAMVPALLRELAARSYRLVHVVPGPLATAPDVAPPEPVAAHDR
jgi:peptidoglycan/xylan/chitin deacetylase (PgdA/CDA1 family)